MNKILLFLISIVIGLELSAQEYRVESFEIAPKDLSARTEGRVDANGRKCALIKVYVKDDITDTDGSVVGKPKYKNGEYWVYIPQGTYQLKLKSERYDPLLLSFREYNIDKVASKNTYELTFHYRDYDWLNMKDYSIEQGPRLKKYAMVVVTLPGAGWTVGGMSTVESLKRLANVISKDGDGWGEKHDCTIIAENEDGNVRTYSLVIESTDDENDAILGAATAYGCFQPIIYQVKQ